METDPYIKLSRIRDDYGLEGRQGTSLKMSELDTFTPTQLTQLRSVLEDECEDIEYQIKLEKKQCEKDARWMYGCKNSLKARQNFIDRIREIQGIDSDDSDIAVKFMRTAKQVLGAEVYEEILATVQNRVEVFSATDIG